MVSFALDQFEQQAEAFLRARLWREWLFLSGQRPGRGLVTLYDEDFPDFTSTDLWADLQATTSEDPRQHHALSSLLAAANLEGRTREFVVQSTRVEVTSTLVFEEHDVPWWEAPVRWINLEEVPRRHELEEAWRGVWRTQLNPTLERWHESLRAQLPALGGDDWLGFWCRMRAIDLDQIGKLAESVLQATADVYGHALGVYLTQLDLPIDDVWTSDIGWALRASRFDADFPDRNRMPVLVRVLRDLGVELQEQTALHLESSSRPGVRWLPLDVPREIHVLMRLVGGWQDYAHSLAALGTAEHLVGTDPSLRFWERSLGDETPTLAYGLLLEGLVRDKEWLAARLDYTASDDFRVISHLAWLYRVRRTAALTLYERQLWRGEPGAAMAAEFEETLSGATRARHFPEQYLQVMEGTPWSALRSAIWLRSEVFAAQLRAFLRREFDEEWWRSSRAVRFIKDELWRPGQRHSAEELLGFMGYEGFDPSVLTASFEEILRPL